MIYEQMTHKNLIKNLLWVWSAGFITGERRLRNWIWKYIILTCAMYIFHIVACMPTNYSKSLFRIFPNLINTSIWRTLRFHAFIMSYEKMEIIFYFNTSLFNWSIEVRLDEYE